MGLVVEDQITMNLEIAKEIEQKRRSRAVAKTRQIAKNRMESNSEISKSVSRLTTDPKL